MPPRFGSYLCLLQCKLQGLSGLEKRLKFQLFLNAWKKNIFLRGGKISKSFMNRGLSLFDYSFKIIPSLN